MKMEYKVNLISAKDAAERLNISVAMLSRLVKSGRIAVIRIGDRTLFNEKILDDFMAANYKPSRDGAGALSA
jgi:excisionase family DNA binding protein